jgi:hypothetical protein
MNCIYISQLKPSVIKPKHVVCVVAVNNSNLIFINIIAANNGLYFINSL